jgi:predicted DNA binding protein
MSVIARISVPPDEFKLGQTLRGHDPLRIEVECVVPLDEEIVPYLWIRGLPVDHLRHALRSDADVERAVVIDHVGEAALVRVVWADRRHPFFDTLVALDATCLDGVGRNDGWHLELRFPSRESLSAFYQECVDRGVTLTVNGIYDRSQPERERVSDALSERQYETLRTAFETGYFSIPREITLEELGDRLGISDTAASQRIRRGLQRLLAEELTTSA